jgi:hypothetical protein
MGERAAAVFYEKFIKALGNKNAGFRSEPCAMTAKKT